MILRDHIPGTPDVLVAELMLSLVYINTLTLDGKLLNKPREYIETPPQTLKCRAVMIVRKLWRTRSSALRTPLGP